MRSLDTYRKTSVTTRSREQLVVLLHDGAIQFLKLALNGLGDESVRSKEPYIQKALDIIDGLNRVLDLEAGGHTAVNLRKLYLFMTTRLNAADIREDPRQIDAVITLLEELNQHFKTTC